MKDPIIINLTEAKENLNESWLRMFGSAVESILKAMFGGYSVPINVKGSRDEINAFAKTLNSEKEYIEAYKKYGLDNPSTYRSKYQLNKAVSDFERKTKILWPFR